jgi:prolipoprotein diacylglyceryl transferase
MTADTVELVKFMVESLDPLPACGPGHAPDRFDGSVFTVDVAVALSPLAEIPSPTQSVWHVGNIPIRAYALCIVVGIIAACVVTEIRMRRRGAPPYLVLDVAVWAVPFGIVGARIYHVITWPAPYFGENGQFLDAFKIWEGGLGIWGAVAGGALGAWFACRQLGIPLAFLAGALAPGLPLAQGIGRWGNYFNNELAGRETDVPWGLKTYQWNEGRAATENGVPIVDGVYHPTFLYESLWDIGVAVLVWLMDRRYRFGKGRAFALYVAAYCVGRFWIEAMRADDSIHVLGMRLNNWTALLVFVAAVAYLVLVRGPQERLVVAEDGTIEVTDVEALEAAGGLAADLADPDPDPSDTPTEPDPGPDPSSDPGPSADPASDPSSDSGSVGSSDPGPTATSDSTSSV